MSLLLLASMLLPIVYAIAGTHAVNLFFYLASMFAPLNAVPGTYAVVQVFSFVGPTVPGVHALALTCLLLAPMLLKVLFLLLALLLLGSMLSPLSNVRAVDGTFAVAGVSSVVAPTVTGVHAIALYIAHVVASNRANADVSFPAWENVRGLLPGTRRVFRHSWGNVKKKLCWWLEKCSSLKAGFSILGNGIFQREATTR
jgi:hypothetical protein